MSLGPWEIALIVLVIFLLFGATRLPNAARSLGRSMRIFKSEMDEMKTDKKAAAKEQEAIEQQQPTAQNYVQQPQQQPQQQPVQQPQQQPVQQPQQQPVQQPQQPIDQPQRDYGQQQ